MARQLGHLESDKIKAESRSCNKGAPIMLSSITFMTPGIIRTTVLKSGVSCSVLKSLAVKSEECGN